MATRRKSQGRKPTEAGRDGSRPRLVTSRQTGRHSNAPRNRRKAGNRKTPTLDLPSKVTQLTPSRDAARVPAKRPGRLRKPAARPLQRPVHHEAVAVFLWCASLLTLVSLATYDPADPSLNASSVGGVRNWIGPAGAYWADLLLQTLGIGAHALGVGLMLAGWRAMVGKRILPGFRETSGTLLLIASMGSFAHIALHSQPGPYPAGGFVGALVGRLFLDHFALAGGYILSGTLVLASLAMTVDGVLVSLGGHGLGAIRQVFKRLHSGWIVLRERQRRLAERRAAMAEVKEEQQAQTWTFGDEALAPESREDTDTSGLRVAKAIELGRRLGDQAAQRIEREAHRRALRDRSEPQLHLDQTVDLPKEELFEAELAPPAAEVDEPEAAADENGNDKADSGVAIHAALPAPPPAVAPAGAEKAPPNEKAAPAPKPRRSLGAKNSEPDIVDVRPKVDVEAIDRAAAESKTEKKAKTTFDLPSATLLDIQAEQRDVIDSVKLRDNAQRLTKTLKHYGIEGLVREIRPGPVITMYEFVPSPGIKISKIASLADDLAMSMEALRVRIVAPIPGKGAVGIEIPNESVETVYLKELITHRAYRRSKAKLPIALGKDIEGNPYVTDMTKMPHLLVAGATGAGKSVSVNAMIMSILFNASPEEVRMIMVDPKMLELSVYDGVPHLLLPVVTDPKKAAVALRWAVAEMERRYKALSTLGVRNLDGYNKKIKAAAQKGEPLTVVTKDKLGNESEEACEHMPYVVIVVDELADLMMVASREVEASIMRLAQMARAAGIHLILATQRPSVDVLTGVIKANFPTRVAFQVASKHDSRTILDTVGAEHLLGRGDMLFMEPGAGGLRRLHGSFVSEAEIERTVAFVKQQGEPEYDESILAMDSESEELPGDDEDKDELWDQALAIVVETRQASISMIQRRLRIGYNRAARLVETMEREGIVGPADGAKPREVLMPAPVGP